MTDNDTDDIDRYEYEGQRNIDDKHARRARDLARDGIWSEARTEAGKIQHYQRSTDLLDELRRDRRRRARTDGGTDTSGTLRFTSAGDLAVGLFDRALEPGDTGAFRLKLAILCAMVARRQLRDAQTDAAQGDH
jgi:hypothetical protein